ncbi:hypothetical protein [Rhodococcus sp. OK302]|uniref:hypothetical protein n=1 Tax=Rhodococcus sp. OK302 TaxID=1882769 RepID=UPI000B93B76E|nr:hypothetical protein [Rhodococcus sp. OK302]OYD60761.1 hypothetical protein BDB13_5640 [Rhodococcus sp. OK302]
MTDTARMPPSVAVFLRGSWWWSRRDELANRQLVDIFARHGHPCADITSTLAVDTSLQVAVENEAARGELADWIDMISTRRGGSGIGNPGHSLGERIDYLTRRLGEKPVTATALRQCRQQIGFIDELLREGCDLPELAHPDEAMTDLLSRYRVIRGQVLAAEPTEP